jgi:hypothetical protein
MTVYTSGAVLFIRFLLVKANGSCMVGPAGSKHKPHMQARGPFKYQTAAAMNVIVKSVLDLCTLILALLCAELS